MATLTRAIMSHRSSRLWLAMLALTGAGLSLDCGDMKSGGSSGETHFLNCHVDVDCASLGRTYRCIGSICRAEQKSSAEAGSSDGAPVAIDHGAVPVPEAAPFDCPSDKLPPSGSGDGLCAPPPPSVVGSFCACSATPGAPGADQCFPVVPAEYGSPCCLTGGCAFDVGAGCTRTPLPLSGQAGKPPPACTGSPSAPGSMLERMRIERVVANAGSLFIGDTDQGSIQRVTQVSKSDCTTHVVDTPVGQIAATDTTLYGTANDAPDGQLIRSIPLDGASPSTIPLSDVLGTSPVYVDAIGADGQALYAIVSYRTDGGSAAVAMEVPCCGGLPRVLGKVPRTTYGGGLGDSTLVRAGDRLFWLTTVELARDGPSTTLVVFDLASGSGTAVFANASVRFSAFDTGSEGAYLAQGGTISVLDPSSCQTSTRLEGRLGVIDALDVTSDTIFWAESSQGLAFSRLFSRPKAGGTPEKLVDTPGRVTWLSADADYVYWAVRGADSLYATTVLRVARP